MKRRVRLLLIGLVALALLPLLLVAFVVLFVDPDRFRGPIETAAAQRLGVPLQLDAGLHWALWPLLAIEAGPGRVRDPASGSPLLQWRALQFGAQWRGLLREELRIERLRVDGLQLALAIDAQGRGNWVPMLEASARQRAASPDAAQRVLGIERLELRDAAISFSDQRDGTAWSAALRAFDVRAVYDAPSGQLRLGDMGVEGNLRASALPASGLPFSVDADSLLYDSARSSVTLPAMLLHVDEGRIELAQSEPLQLAPLAGSGTLRASVGNLREWLGVLGIVVPQSADDDVPGEFVLSTDWQVARNRVDLSALQVTADDTKVAGSAMWPLDDASPILFELAGDDIDLDRYLPPADAPSEPFVLPVQSLRELAIEGSISFRSVKLRGITMRNTRFTVPKS